MLRKKNLFQGKYFWSIRIFYVTPKMVTLIYLYFPSVRKARVMVVYVAVGPSSLILMEWWRDLSVSPGNLLWSVDDCEVCDDLVVFTHPTPGIYSHHRVDHTAHSTQHTQSTLSTPPSSSEETGRDGVRSRGLQPTVVRQMLWAELLSWRTLYQLANYIRSEINASPLTISDSQIFL